MQPKELAIRERVTLDQRLQTEAGMKTMVQEGDRPDF